MRHGARSCGVSACPISPRPCHRKSPPELRKTLRMGARSAPAERNCSGPTPVADGFRCRRQRAKIALRRHSQQQVHSPLQWLVNEIDDFIILACGPVRGIGDTEL